eukprot:Gb_27135 [translate_table: standard]
MHRPTDFNAQMDYAMNTNNVFCHEVCRKWFVVILKPLSVQSLSCLRGSYILWVYKLIIP